MGLMGHPVLLDHMDLLDPQEIEEHPVSLDQRDQLDLEELLDHRVNEEIQDHLARKARLDRLDYLVQQALLVLEGKEEKRVNRVKMDHLALVDDLVTRDLLELLD